MIRYPSLVAALALLPACPLLDVQASVPDACVTYTGVQVGALPSAPMQIDESFTVDQLDAFKQLTDQGFELGFVLGEVRATSGITDFSFVDSATISLASGDSASTLPTLDAFGCQPCTGSGGTLDLAASTAANAAPYVDSGSVVVSVDLAGRAPSVAWTMDVEVCMTASVSKSFTP